MKALLDTFHRLLARSSVAAGLAVKIRNQVNCIIAYHLGETANSEKNGEFMLVKHLSPHISTFIDVGANVGEWSAHLLRHCQAKGFLFEPSTLCVSKLQERFRDRTVTIFPAAVADQAGTALFAEEDHCGEGSSLAEARNDQQTPQKEVRVTTLDSEFPATDDRIDFLKIDTEGHDLKVMKGAAALLARTRFLQFEYNYHWVLVGSSLAEAGRFLNSLGFSLFLIRSTGLHPLRYEVWNDYFRYSNFFACRQEDLDCIRPLLREPI